MTDMDNPDGPDTLQRCGSCRWWKPLVGLGGVSVKYGDCTGVPGPQHYGPPDSWPAVQHVPKPGFRAEAHDGSDHIAGLVTQPDFGCVEWEPHPDAS